MKNLIFMLLLAGSIGGVYAQNAEKKDKFSPDTPLFEELTNVKKKTDPVKRQTDTWHHPLPRQAW